MRNGVSETELVDHQKNIGGERVTMQQIEDSIEAEYFFTAEEAVTALGAPATPACKLLTICILTLWNGFSIIGKSACADPTMFNEELGRRLAKADAVNQIWPLMGYELKSRLARDARLLGGAPVTPHPGSTTYIGTKAVAATPMNRRDYNFLRGWSVPRDEDPDDEGYLVEYLDSPEPNHENYGGYISWSPAEIFERAYRPVRKAASAASNVTAEVLGMASGKDRETLLKNQQNARSQMRAL